MTEVGGLPLGVTSTIDTHAMNTGTDLDSVTLDLDPVTTTIGAVAAMTLIEVGPGHFTKPSHHNFSHDRSSSSYCCTVMIHPTTDPHLTGTLPKMTAGPAIGPGNTSTNLTEGLHPLHSHRPGNIRTEDTNESQLMTCTIGIL